MLKTTDPVVLAVIDKLDSRSAVGLEKYGVGLDRPDLSPREWLQHLQEELLDAANYVECVLRTISEAEGRAYRQGQISMREQCRGAAQKVAEDVAGDPADRRGARRVEIAIMTLPVEDSP